MGADCKSVAFSFDGSNPSSPTNNKSCIFMQDIFYALKKTLFRQNVQFNVDSFRGNYMVKAIMNGYDENDIYSLFQAS